MTATSAAAAEDTASPNRVLSAANGIDYAYRSGAADWRAAAGAEAARLAREVWAASGW